ncbi:enoyl-CoA hydratase [Rhodococcus sp. Leaf7]|uniref:enoyl-CoA hydratase-related protein n=1 Tax=unclassified Rhodococcus (in: high G+C Gram-positive bacteria) TaxID=192944 RepID=UPI0006F3499F|nr:MULTISPECIES: enoyl-CoA hydratase-related protein [unclassified Rhodococcus (in: high G+C Gram-positive bacteria)]KQU07617.1 enoyl-CoA hydratase [Rhodococcus sp. Leaf7]KQU43137.1 enoyl-CoA hydratase [Rhodococcus sp. Leaf247]
MTDQDAVLTEVRDHVLLVTINRPRAANSVNAEVHTLLGEAWERADGDDTIRAVVLTATGNSTFCGGADLKALGTRGPDGVTPPETAHWGFAGITRHPISTPVIVAVTGNALGGGTEIALSGDLVIASTTARFGLPEVHRGLIAGAGGLFRLVDAIPRAIAMELILTGEPMTAQDAARWGLVNHVVEPERVLDTALELAEKISAGAPLAIKASKVIARGIEDGRIASESAAWAETDRALARLSTSSDTVEGIMAFMEKRAPRWTGL